MTEIDLLTLVHSWYPSNCCSGQDCFPVLCSSLKQILNGAIEYTTDWYQWIFSNSMIHISPNDQCHVCIYQGNPRCVFLTPGA